MAGHGVPRCGENEKISERKLAWSNSGYFQDLPEKETTSNGIQTSGDNLRGCMGKMAELAALSLRNLRVWLIAEAWV